MSAGKSDTVTLDEVMLALDTVDGLRHDTRLAARELDETARDEELIARMRRLYDAQGLRVSDALLEEGVETLKAARFTYRPAPLTWRTALARAWVWRERIGMGLAGLVMALGLLWVANEMYVEGPRRAIAERAEAVFVAIADGQASPEAASLAGELRARVAAELEDGDRAEAEAVLASLEALREALPLAYGLHVVDASARTRPNALHLRDHFLTLEARDGSGAARAVPFVIDGERVDASRLTVPVSAETYTAVQREAEGGTLADIAPIAVKEPGEAGAVYRIPTTGLAVPEAQP